MNQLLEAETVVLSLIQAEIIAEILAEVECEVLGEIKVNPFLGFTDIETVKLDFDNRSFRNTKYWADRALKRFRLRGFVVLKSSVNHYHVVFDRKVSWAENLCVVGWVAVCSRNKELLKWLAMQCIKGASTLRVAPKEDKPSPRIVYRYGEKNRQIESFLKYRRLIKRMHKSIN